MPVPFFHFFKYTRKTSREKSLSVCMPVPFLKRRRFFKTVPGYFLKLGGGAKRSTAQEAVPTWPEIGVGGIVEAEGGKRVRGGSAGVWGPKS